MILSNNQLKRSAELSEVLARYTCSCGAGNDDCSWYHGAWQYLRLLDIVGSPEWHEEFFTTVSNSTLNSGSSVLISGAADQTMLALLMSATEAHHEINFDVVDSCMTPLILNDHYGSQMGVNVDTTQSDIRRLIKKSNRYDLIITDEFLTRFQSSEKRDVVDQWASLLRPSGKVATTCRIADTNNGSDEDELRSFTDRALSQAQEREVPVSTDQLHRLARRFADRYASGVSYPIRSVNAARELFVNSGFSTVKTNIVEHRTQDGTEQCRITAVI